MRTFSCGSVTTTAISMMRSRSGHQAGHLEVDPDQVGVVGSEFVVGRSSADRKRARRRTPTLSAMKSVELDARLRPRAGRLAGAARLAREPPGAARGAPSRRRARAVPGHGRAWPRTARRPTTRSPASASASGRWCSARSRCSAGRCSAASTCSMRPCSTPCGPRWGGLAYGVALFAAVFAIEGLLHLPLDLYATFGIEARFGFNRMTWRLWLERRGQGPAAGRRHRRAAGGARALDHGGERRALVALGLVRLGGVQPDRPGRLLRP